MPNAKWLFWCFECCLQREVKACHLWHTKTKQSDCTICYITTLFSATEVLFQKCYPVQCLKATLKVKHLSLHLAFLLIICLIFSFAFNFSAHTHVSEATNSQESCTISSCTVPTGRMPSWWCSCNRVSFSLTWHLAWAKQKTKQNSFFSFWKTALKKLNRKTAKQKTIHNTFRRKDPPMFSLSILTLRRLTAGKRHQREREKGQSILCGDGQVPTAGFKCHTIVGQWTDSRRRGFLHSHQRACLAGRTPPSSTFLSLSPRPALLHQLYRQQGPLFLWKVTKHRLYQKLP